MTQPSRAQYLIPFSASGSSGRSLTGRSAFRSTTVSSFNRSGSADTETDVNFRRALSPVVLRHHEGPELKKNKYLPFEPESLTKHHGSSAQKNHDFLKGFEDNTFVLCIPIVINGQHVRIGIGCPITVRPETRSREHKWRRYHWKWMYKKAAKQFKIIVSDQDFQTERAVFVLWQSDRDGKFDARVDRKYGSLNVLACQQWQHGEPGRWVPLFTRNI